MVPRSPPSSTNSSSPRVKPQRYGTQFKSTDDGLAMIQVEDPGGLDSLRARTLLPPIEIYRAQLARQYHLKPSNRIASPAAPAAQ